jgi:hypothetical protein
MAASTVLSTGAEDGESVGAGGEVARGGESVNGLFNGLVSIWDLSAALGAGEDVDVVNESWGQVDEFAFGAEGDSCFEEDLNSANYGSTTDSALESAHNVFLHAWLQVF